MTSTLNSPAIVAGAAALATIAIVQVIDFIRDLRYVEDEPERDADYPDKLNQLAVTADLVGHRVHGAYMHIPFKGMTDLEAAAGLIELEVAQSRIDELLFSLAELADGITAVCIAAGADVPARAVTEARTSETA